MSARSSLVAGRTALVLGAAYFVVEGGSLLLGAVELAAEARQAVEAAARIGGDGRGRDAPRPVHGEAIAVAVVLREHVVGPIRGAAAEIMEVRHGVGREAAE